MSRIYAIRFYVVFAILLSLLLLSCYSPKTNAYGLKVKSYYGYNNYKVDTVNWVATKDSIWSYGSFGMIANKQVQ